jgi:hypothetical protein
MKRRVLPFHRLGRVILFRVSDLEHALDKYRVAPVGEPRPRKITTTPTITEPPTRKRRMQRVKPD